MYLIMLRRCLPSKHLGGWRLRMSLTFFFSLSPSLSLPHDAQTQYLSLVLLEKSSETQISPLARSCANSTFCTEQLLRARLKWVSCCMCLMSTETTINPCVVQVYFRDRVTVSLTSSCLRISNLDVLMKLDLEILSTTGKTSVIWDTCAVKCLYCPRC